MLDEIKNRILSTKPSMLIVGDVMLDEYVFGTSTRVSPESPSVVLDYERREIRAGGAANAAANCESLGASAALVSVTGHDEFGKELEESLQQELETTRFCVSSERQTTVKTRLIANNQQVLRVDRESRIDTTQLELKAIVAAFDELIAQCDAVVLSDYGKGVLSSQTCNYILQRSVSHNKVVVVDPKGKNFQKYAGATIITPNVLEGCLALGIEDQGAATSVADVGQGLQAVLPGTTIAVTRGADGVSVFEPGIDELHFPAEAKHVFDVTGAGDTFVSALSIALAAEASLSSAIQFANRAAAIVVGKRGTSTVSLAEI